MSKGVLEILMQSALDQSDKSIARLKKDAQALESKLQDEKIQLNVELNKDSLRDVEQELRQVSETLKVLSSEEGFSKLQQDIEKSTFKANEFEEGIKKIRKQANLLSETHQFNLLDNSSTHIKEAQKDLLTIEKTIKSFNDDGEVLTDIVEERVGYLKIQKELYNDLSKTLNNISQLESSKIKASEDDRQIIDNQITKQKELAKTIQATIDTHGLKNEKLQNEIQATQKLKEIQRSIREEADKERQSIKAYQEMTKLMKEEYQLQKEMVGTQGEVNQGYQDRLAIVRQLQQELHSNIVGGGLSDTGRESALQQERDRLKASTELAVQLKTQKNLYKELEEALRTLNGLENSRIKASENEKGNIDSKIQQQRAIISGINQEIEASNLRNRKLDESINMTQQLKAIQRSIREELDEDRQSTKAYQEMTKLVREEGQIIAKMSGTQGELNEKYAERLNVVKELQTELQKQMVTENLIRQDKDKELQQERDKVVTNAKLTQHLKTQKELYNDLSKTLQIINQLESNKIKAGEKDRAVIESQIAHHKDILKTTMDTIDAMGVRNSKLDQEIKATQRLKEIQQSIRQESSKESQSKQAYSELTRLAKEEGRIAKQMIGTQGEVNEKYRERLQLVQSLQSAVKSQIGTEGLHSPERELILKQEIEKITNDIAIAESKATAQEELRIARLNERLATLQDIAQTQETIDVRGNQEQIENLIRSMEYFEKASKDGKMQILSYSQAIDSNNNAQAKLTVQTRESSGIMKEHKIVVDEATQSIYKLGEKTKEATSKSSGMIARMSETLKRTVQWGLANKIMGAFTSYIRDSISHVRDLDKELNQVAIVTGATYEQTQALANSYADLGIQLGKTVKEISEVNTNLIRQGLSAEEAMSRMQTTLQLSASSGMDANKTLSVITSGVNALGVEANHLSDVLLKAGKISASSAEEVGDGLTRVASSAKMANTTLEQSSALLATMIEVTQESPSSLGNSLKTLMARVNKINEETGDYNETLNETQKAFESAGVQFLDGYKQVRPYYDLLSDLNQVWGTLDTNTKNYIATASAGANQRNRFLAIMENFNRVQEIHNELLYSEGTLMEDYGVYLDSVEAKANKFTATLEKSWQNFLDSDLLKQMIDSGTTALEVLTGVMGLFNTSMLEFLAIGVGLNDTISRFSKGVAKQYTRSIEGGAKSNKSFSEGLMEMEGGLGRLAKYLVPHIMNMKGLDWQNKITYISQKMLNAEMKATIATMAIQAGAYIGMTVGIAVLVKGLGTLVTKIKNSRKEMEELNTEVRSNVASHQKNIGTLKSVSDRFAELQEKMHDVTQATSMTNEEQEEYYALSQKIADIAPEVVSGFDDKGRAIIRYGTEIDKLIEKEERLISVEHGRLLADEGKIGKSYDSDMKKSDKERMELEMRIFEAQSRLETIETEIARREEQGQSTGYLVENMEAERKKLIELRTEMDGLIVLRQEAQEGIMGLIDARMHSIKTIEGVTDSTADMIKTLALSTADQEGYGSAKELITDLTLAIEDYHSSVQGMSFENTIEQTEQFAQALQNMGLEQDNAHNLIYQLAQDFQLFGESVDMSEVSVQIHTDNLKEYTAEMDRLSEVYQKVAQGQQLSASEMADLIIQYDELAVIVEEHGEITIDHLDVVTELMEKVAEARMDDLRAMQQQNAKQIESVKNYIEVLERLLEVLSKFGGVHSSVYKSVKKELDSTYAKLDDLTQQYEKTTRQISALEQVSIQDDQARQTKAHEVALKSAIQSANELRSILDELNQQGQLSQETVLKIIENYPELIYYINDEVTLRQKLIEKIEENTLAQDKHYRDMLMMTDEFTMAFYNKHSSLVDDVARMYNIDVRNFRNATDAKIGMLNAFNASFTKAGQEMAESMGGGAKGQLGMMKSLLRLKQDPRSAQLPGASGMWDVYSTDQQQMSVSDIQKQIALLEQWEGFADSFKPTKPISKIPTMSSIGKGGGGKTSSAGKKKGGTGKTKTTRQIIEEIELLTDRYLKFEKAVREVNRSMELNEGLMGFASGEDRLKLMDKANNLLKEQQRLISLRANEARKEKTELEKSLKKYVNVADGTFGADSFAQYTKKAESSINSLIKQINKTSDDTTRDNLTKQKDKMQKNYDKVKADFDKYIELRSSIPDMSAEWWMLEYEVLTRSLEAIDIQYERYDKEIEYLSDQLTYVLGIREDNRAELEREYEILQAMASLNKQALHDIEQQVESSSKRVKVLEGRLAKMGNKRNAEYEKTARALVVARAEQDKYFEQYRIQLNNLASQQQSIIERYKADMKRAYKETMDAIDNIRVKFDDFDKVGFLVSIEKIISDLNVMDGIFAKSVDTNLETTNARQEIQYWKDSILETALELKQLEQEINTVSSKQVDTRDEAIAKQELLAEMLEAQVEKENDLKILERDLQQEIAQMELDNKNIENSLQNQIDLRKEELKQLQEKVKEEDKIRAIKLKQLELMKTMDDTRFTYITGRGEEVFTYDQEKVLKLQQELADMLRKDRQDTEQEELNKTIQKMQDDLNRTREVNKQELEVLKLAQQGISELVGIISNTVSNSSKLLEEAYDGVVDKFATEMKNEMTEFTNFYQAYWDAKADRIVADIVQDRREIDKGKLGGKTNEKYGTFKNPKPAPSRPQVGGKVDNDTSSTSPSKPSAPSSSVGGGNLNALTTYTVQQGETIQDIANKFNTTIERLQELNKFLKTRDPKQYDGLVVPQTYTGGGYTGGWSKGINQKDLLLTPQDQAKALQLASMTQINDLQSRMFEKPEKDDTTTPIVLNNPSFNEIHNSRDFANELMGWTRGNFPKLS